VDLIEKSDAETLDALTVNATDLDPADEDGDDTITGTATGDEGGSQKINGEEAGGSSGGQKSANNGYSMLNFTIGPGKLNGDKSFCEMKETTYEHKA